MLRLCKTTEVRILFESSDYKFTHSHLFFCELLQRSDVFLIYLYRQTIFWMNRKFLNGFTNAFEQNDIVLPDECMDEAFQEKFMENMYNVFSDILNGNIFEDNTFEQHMVVFLSSVSF